MNKNSDNKVHVYGFVNGVRIKTENGSNFIYVDLATYEEYKNNAGEKERKYTFHTVNIVTSNDEVVKNFKDVRAALANNYENRGTEGFEPKTFTASVDGKLVTREREIDGVKHWRQNIFANEEDFKLGARRQKDEKMNTASFKGNISDVKILDSYAVVSIATHYFVPGESENHKGEKMPYTEKTSFVQTRISENFRPETFEALKKGELAVGDLIEARGQMHNNNFTDKNGVKRYGIVVDLNKVNLIAKKTVKKEQQEEKKTEKKAAKKATPNKKKGKTV